MLDNLHKRNLLFLIGCIGTRTLLAYFAKIVPMNILQIMGWIALLPALGFLYFFFSGTRKTGPEVLGEKIWWNHLRPLHAFIYFIFAYMAIHSMRSAWIVLAIDVIIGLLAFIWNRGNQ